MKNHIRPKNALYLSQVQSLVGSEVELYISDGKFDGYWKYLFKTPVRGIKLMANVPYGLRPACGYICSRKTSSILSYSPTFMLPQVYNLGYFDDNGDPVDESNTFNDTLVFADARDVTQYLDQCLEKA